MRYIVRAALLLLPVLMLTLAGCGSSSSGNADPFNPGGTIGGTDTGAAPYTLTVIPAKTAALVNEEMIVTATLRDANSRPVADQTVNFSIAAGPATAVIASAKTDSNGVALAFIRAGATAVTTNVIVQGASTVGGKSVVGYGSFQVSPADVNLNSARLSLAASSSAVSPNQQLLITATARDGSNNPVSNLAVSFRIAAGPATVLTANSVTDSNGQATAIVNAGNPSSVANVIVEATTTVNTDQIVANVPFQVVPTANSTVSYRLTMTPSKQVVDNNEEFYVTAFLKDSGGTPVPGKTVNFTVATGEASVITASATTGSSGECFARVRALNPASTSAVILQASATIDSTTVTALAPVQITTQPLSASIIKMTLVSDKASVGVNSDVILTASVTDLQSPPKPVQNKEVSFKVLAGPGNMVDFSGNVLAQGVATLAATDSLGNAVCRLRSGTVNSSSSIIVQATTTVNDSLVTAYTTIEVVRQNSYVINFLTSKSPTDPDGTLNTLSATLPADAAGLFTFKQLVPFQALDNNGVPMPNLDVSIEINNTGRNADTLIQLIPPLPGLPVTYPGVNPLTVTVRTDDHGMGIFTCNVSLEAPGPGGFNAESIIYQATATVDGVTLRSYGGFIASLTQEKAAP